MITIDDLHKLSLFSTLRPEHLEVLLKNLRPLHMEEGESLVQEGVVTHGPLFIITDGNVEVSKLDSHGKPRTLVILEPPTVIGEIEFLGDIESSATVTTHDEVSGYLLPRARFEALFEAGEPAAYHLALAIGKLVSERLAQTNKLLSKALTAKSEVGASDPSPEGQTLSELDAEINELLSLS